MKKSFIIIILITLFLIVISSVVAINIRNKASRVVKMENKAFEQYLNSEIYGTDVMTLINKADNTNKSNGVQKDTKGYYIKNNTNSIQIDIEFITDEEEEKTTTYKMEQILKLGSSEFIKNFNEAKFKCTSKDYHKETGKLAYIKFTHISE